MRVLERLKEHEGIGDDRSVCDLMDEAAYRIEQLTDALGKLLDNLPPDFPNRSYYDEITAGN